MKIFETRFAFSDIHESTPQNCSEAQTEVIERADKYVKWYSENGFFEKLKKVGNKIGATVLYPVLLLYSALKSPETSAKDKLIITSTLGYFILPTDLIPDFIAGIGFGDDAAAMTACIAVVRKVLTKSVRDDTATRINNLFGSIDQALLDKFVDGGLDTVDNINNKG